MSISVDISEADLQNAIAVGIAEAFSPEKRDALFRDIVRAHLTVKVGTYEKETVLSKAVGDKIREIAAEQVVTTLEGLRPEIESVVASLLGPAFKGSIMTALTRDLKSMVVRNISISATLDKV